MTLTITGDVRMWDKFILLSSTV